MKKQKQRIVNNIYGDCFSACLATLLELPIEVVPNDHSEYYFFIYEKFLEQFGIAMNYRDAKGAIWQDHPWIASVKSKNYSDGTTHAIIMENGSVLFDPSTKHIYKKGESLLGKNIVQGGYIFSVSDFSRLHKLKEYRDKLALSPERKQTEVKE